MTDSHRACAEACANIAFIKYWGNADEDLHWPANGSISMNLGALTTRTSVTFEPGLPADQLVIDGLQAGAGELARISRFLNVVRQGAGVSWSARVESKNSFPRSAGLASSASAFAALALASTHALGQELSEAQLSRLARLGSGSACRSVPGGFVEWDRGKRPQDSFARSLAPAGYWDLVDCIALVTAAPKLVSSLEGHRLAPTSPLQTARVGDAPRRIAACRTALLTTDFLALATISELDCRLMHAVMMTSSPPLLYWAPATLAVIQAVQAARQDGVAVFYTIDAGPNVHLICPRSEVERVRSMLAQVPGIAQVLVSSAGGPARLIPNAEWSPGAP
jgi:diphosphomevalonate decarboxylase